MKPEVILEALSRAGATFLDETAEPAAEKTPTHQGRPDGGGWPEEQTAVSGGRRSGGWICRSTWNRQRDAER